ncbi:MAG: polyphosphate--glucose phosphotransferase [Opitutales bacterium]
MEVLGIDIGGSGIKGAVVDLEKGDLVTERLRVETPSKEAGTEAFFDALADLVKQFSWSGPLGMGFPGVIRAQRTYTAANLNKKLIGVCLSDELEKRTGLTGWAVNDADAAGLAEARYGAAKDFPGVALLITVGTGLGTALLLNGQLAPNTEFGHLKMLNKAKDKLESAEKFSAASARSREDLSWSEWAERFNRYLEYVMLLMCPQRIIIGGGISKKGEKWLKHIEVDAEVVTAELENKAGIVGAAIAAAEKTGQPAVNA